MKKFKKIYIEITNCCNRACDFCPGTNRPGRYMSRDLFVRVLEQIQGYTDYVHFHLLGEPLLHPELGELLDLCEKFFFRVHITTNGILIDKAADALLSKPALRQVSFSLHCIQSNDQAPFIYEYISKIRDFIEKSKNFKPIYVSLRLWNLNSNRNSENSTYLLKTITDMFSLSCAMQEKLAAGEAMQIDARVFIHQALQFQWPDIQGQMLGRKGFCLGLRNQAGILADGTVVPCCLDAEGVINLGNINEESFKSIIAGDRARKMHEGFSRMQVAEPLCQRCGYRLRFSRKTA